MSDELSSLAGFAGVVRLFPLPNVVMFPHVIQPLHIFEPRYRQMTADALAGDQLIAMVLLREGWETNYGGAPAIHAVACLGRIVADQKLDDGRFNLLLRGVSRVQLAEEILCPGKPYRQARVQLLADVSELTAQREKQFRRQLIQLVPAWFPVGGPVLSQFRKVLKSDLPLGALCDILSFALPLDVGLKETLLEELDVDRRARTLIHHLQSATPPKVQEAATAAAASTESQNRKFPPDFSPN